MPPSYQRSVEIIKSAQTCPTLAMPAKARNASMAKALERIGTAKAASSRGMSKERTIKKKPKCDFPVRKSGIKPVTKKRGAKVEIKKSAK